MPSDDYHCKHCAKRIVKVNFALGEKWVHQPAGASFQNGMYTSCQLTVAEPRDDGDYYVPPEVMSRFLKSDLKRKEPND